MNSIIKINILTIFGFLNFKFVDRQEYAQDIGSNKK